MPSQLAGVAGDATEGVGGTGSCPWDHTPGADLFMEGSFFFSLAMVAGCLCFFFSFLFLSRDPPVCLRGILLWL